jgi:hypothetical protein
MTMHHSVIALVHCVLLLAVTLTAKASACISKAELEALALESLQPVFTSRDARLNKVVLSDSYASVCLAPDVKPTIRIAENGVLFSKMWLELALASGKSLRYQAGLTFDKRVWRVNQSHTINHIVSLEDVTSDWMLSTRLTSSDSLFTLPDSQYRVLRNISKNQIISDSDVALLRLIEVGQNVLAKYQIGGIAVEAKARALSAGNLHDTIAVLLNDQQEPVKAVIQNRMDVYVQE